MAQQISVNSATGNIQIQISRGAIGPSTTANVANTALNLNAASTSNVIIGGGTNGYVLATDGAGNTSWVAQTGGGATNPAGSNTQVQFNDAGAFGAESTFTYDKTTDVLTVDHFSGEGGNISNIAGANVSGAVALATSATSANAVAYANVSGTPTLGNISTINIDGNVANVLRGDGSFAADANSSYGDSNVVTLLNAFGSNTITTTGLITGNGGGLSNIAGANVSGEVSFAATANSVAGANVSGSVANATLADFATTANAVAGANVSGEVTNATHSTISDSANSVAVANVSGIGNIATINLDGNTSNYLGGTGVWGPIAGGANANFANYAGNVTLSNQPNITQTGNLISFTVDDAVANTATHQIDPALITMPVNYTDTKAQEVITLFGDDNIPNYFGGQGTTTYLMNDITAGFIGFSPIITDYAASNGAGGYYQSVRVETGMDFVGFPASGTQAYVPGRVVYTFAGLESDMSSTSSTLGEIKLSQGGLDIQTRTTTAKPSTQSGIIDVNHYGTDAGNEAASQLIGVRRRRGNNASRVSIAAGDYLGNIQWQGLYNAGGGQGQGTTIAPRVSPAFSGSGVIPVGIELYTTDSTGATNLTEFGSDGDSFFPGNLTLNNSGIFIGDGGGLSNIASANVSGLGNIVTTNLDGNSANYLTGTGTWAPAVGSPGGFSGTIQFNNSGTLDGDNRFQFNPTGGYGTQPQITLEGQPNNVPGIFSINNGVLAMNTENLSGGYAPMSFSTFNANPYMEPIVYYRARGTRSVPTAVVAGDIIKNERIQCYSAPGGFPLTNAQAGTVTSTVQANDGLGNIAASYTISTAKPANGPNSLDKIVLDTEYVQAIGNIEMTTKSAVFAAGLVQQPSYLFANLPSGISPGTRSFISDGATVTFRGAAAGGGTDFAPVFFDGGVWRYG
jgi:hypothetical protein